MENRFKFRAYFKEFEKIFYDCIPINKEFTEWIINLDNDMGAYDGDFTVGEDIEIMQYTGLKDKNGKEIYEGDILKLYLDNCYFKVEYDIYNGFQAKDGDGGTLPTFNYHKSEIIGNIYQNPELLNK